jgi:hypothetical protein
MHIRRLGIWLQLVTLLAVGLTCTVLWAPGRAMAQERNTPTHPPPPPTRTQPAGARVTPTYTPVPPPTAPPAGPGTAPTPTATAEPPEVMPVTGHANGPGTWGLYGLLLLGLSTLVLAWGLKPHQGSDRPG